MTEGPDPDAPVTLEQARSALAAVRPRIDQFLSHRADLAELRADLATTGHSDAGGLAEAKGLEARLHAELEHITGSGAQVKGWAPLLLDWPGERDGVPVLWCWLEGEPDIGWYHRRDCGFPCRRPL